MNKQNYIKPSGTQNKSEKSFDLSSNAVLLNVPFIFCFQCEEYSACSDCASSLETCADRDLSELSEQHQLLQDTLDMTRDEMQDLLLKSARRREQLMSEAQNVFTENLWIMPMARAFQETKDNFQVRIIIIPIIIIIIIIEYRRSY